MSSTAEQVRASRAKRTALGLVRVELWVPEDEAIEFRSLAAKACWRHERELRNASPKALGSPEKGVHGRSRRNPW